MLLTDVPNTSLQMMCRVSLPFLAVMLLAIAELALAQTYYYTNMEYSVGSSCDPEQRITFVTRVYPSVCTFDNDLKKWGIANVTGATLRAYALCSDDQCARDCIVSNTFDSQDYCTAGPASNTSIRWTWSTQPASWTAPTGYLASGISWFFGGGCNSSRPYGSNVGFFKDRACFLPHPFTASALIYSDNTTYVQITMLASTQRQFKYCKDDSTCTNCTTSTVTLGNCPQGDYTSSSVSWVALSGMTSGVATPYSLPSASSPSKIGSPSPAAPTPSMPVATPLPAVAPTPNAASTAIGAAFLFVACILLLVDSI